jgi:hypothetical protein
MDELGIDLARHRPRTFDELEDDYFDLVISLSPQAQHRAVELTRDRAAELEFWNMPDPSVIDGTREQRLDAYRRLRDILMDRILARFPTESMPNLGAAAHRPAAADQSGANGFRRCGATRNGTRRCAPAAEGPKLAVR